MDNKLQNIDIKIFTQLEKNDIIFIDSTHVSKYQSDVNHILFNILPQMEPGIFIHFHDIFYPFEYPKEWLLKGHFWNEAYILRSFLMFNNYFEIFVFNTLLETFFLSWFENHMPLCLKNTGGSIWIKKIQ